ncbi:coiled-coil domain-containing protein [Geosporobacter ferrireducens]|uniref:N-terminal domain of peptidoglycan hydrolase CwlO-containing protein n=1 Tax=Geosporobacter ferrireducens TaxID=1424294 RepID=A0A1D8GMG8_9FIRM|nr:hypothetical protein [Geosporobacter ferrireducens]AOT72094.1 hypothetical protein Gferi_22670 [Geosporobacter ferrireducens]MTI55980.1 hypothetical protein [Geosporobacter ferrireducens]
MVKMREIKRLLIFCFTATFILILFSSIMVTGEGDPFAEIQEKLAGISIEEREILKKLFVLAREVEDMERAEAEIEQEIESVNQEVKYLENAIALEEMDYENKLDVLRQILRSYQRRGAGSYLEIILSSDNLATFLRRINTFRDLTRNTGELLLLLEDSREKLSKEKKKLTEKLVLIEEKQEELRESLVNKLQLVEAQEAYLASLAGERVFYQEYLTSLQNLLDELGTFFTEVAGEFSRIIEEGNLPSDTLKTSITLYHIKGSIEEKTFNNIIKENPRLPEMIFSFQPGKIEMSIPQKNLTLIGDFVILDGKTLKFQVEEGAFYGMPLEKGTIEGLFRESHLVLDLKPLVGKNIIQSIEVFDGYLELKIIPNLF